jgi:hypothetical protein
MKGADIPFDLPEGVGGGGPARNLPSGDGGTPKKKPNRYVPAPLGDNVFVPKSLMDQGILAKQARPDGTLPANAFENTMNSDNLSAGDKAYIRKALELMPEAVNEKGDIKLDALRIAVNNLYKPKLTSTFKFADYGLSTFRDPENGTWESRKEKISTESDQVLEELNNIGVEIDEELYDNVVESLVKWTNQNLAYEHNLTGSTLRPLSGYRDYISMVERSIDNAKGSIFSKPLIDENGKQLPDSIQTTAGPFIKFEYGEYVPNAYDTSEIFPLLNGVATEGQKKRIINEFAKSANDMQYIADEINEDTNDLLTRAISRLDDTSFSPDNSELLAEYVIDNHPILRITNNINLSKDSNVVFETYKKIEQESDSQFEPTTYVLLNELNYDNYSTAAFDTKSDGFIELLNNVLDEDVDNKDDLFRAKRDDTYSASRNRIKLSLESASDYNFYLSRVNEEKENLASSIKSMSSDSYLPLSVKKELIRFFSQISDAFFDQNNLTTFDTDSGEIKFYQMSSGYYDPQTPLEYISSYLAPRSGRSLNDSIDRKRFIEELFNAGFRIPSSVYKDMKPEDLEVLEAQIAYRAKDISFRLNAIEANFKSSMRSLNELFITSTINSFLRTEIYPSNLRESVEYIDKISKITKAYKKVKQDRFSKRNKALQSLIEKGKDPKKVNIGRTTFLVSANNTLKESGFRGPKESGNSNEYTHWEDTSTPGAWGHIRVEIDPDDPETLIVPEFQSDLFQTSKMGAEQGARRAKGEFNELEAPFLRSLKEVDTYQRTLLYQAVQIAVNNGQTRIAIPTKDTATIVQMYPTEERWREEMDYSERLRKASSPIKFPKKEGGVDEKTSAALEKIRNDYEVQARFFAKELNVPLKLETIRGYTYHVIDIPDKFLKRQADMPTFEKGGKFTIKKIMPKKFLRAMKKK